MAILLGSLPAGAAASVFLERAPAAAGPPKAVTGGSISSPRELIRVGDMLFLPGESGFVGQRWTGGQVYYAFAADVTWENRDRFEAAAHEWEETVNGLAGETLLRFSPRVSEPNYIVVVNSSENSSRVGMNGGAQELRLHDWPVRRTILHEIGHALGLAHEHQRGDRDGYVEILEDNIEPDQVSNFDIEQTTAFGDYDFLSVMHYAGHSFSANGQRTIVPRPGYEAYEDLLGNYGCEQVTSTPCLTARDAEGMVHRYSERQSAGADCDFTPSPADWRQSGRMYYRLLMDKTWLFVPTAHLQIQTMDPPFARGGKVSVNTNTTPGVRLYGDEDLHSALGTPSNPVVQYSAGSGSLDYWFWADFDADSVGWVRLTHIVSGEFPTYLTWNVDVRCGGAAGLDLAPDLAFEPAGEVGGSFDPSSRTYGLTNHGSSSLGYTVSVSYGPSGAGWLTLSRTSGSLAAGQSGSFVASMSSSAGGLGKGTYTATIVVKTTGSSPQTLTRTVSLTVENGPSLPPVLAGRVTTGAGAPLEGVRMDGLPSVSWTDENGEYQVYVGSGWSGTARPFKPGYSFSPVSRSYSGVQTGLAGQDYAGAAKTFVVSGRVTLNGAGLAGVLMSGLPGTPTTGADGSYSAVVPFHWSGTVTPSSAGHVFTPESITYSEVGMDRVEEAYTAVGKTVTVSGRVTLGTAGLAEVWLSGMPGSVISAADGTYEAAVPYGWSGTSTPIAPGYVFSPSSRTFSGLESDFPALDFAASQAPPGSGRLWIVANTTDLNSAATSSRPGDMIVVRPGTYLDVEIGGLDPQTVLVSEAGADQTVLNLKQQLVVNMSDVILDGFSFRSPATWTFEPIHVSGSSNVRFRNCRFYAPDAAYGVRVTSAQNLLIESSVFSGYGGVLLRSGASTGTLTLRNDHFVGNTVGVLGGSNPSLQVVLENNLFRNAVRDAVDISSVGSLTARNNLFDGNATAWNLASIPGAVQLIQDTVVRNGVGYDLSGTMSVLIYNAIHQGNTRALDGGGNVTASLHHVLHWQDDSWLYGSAHYNLDESTIWQSDPRFVSWAAGDFRLAAGSPAIGKGQGGVDLGAYGGTLGSAWKTPPGAPQARPALLSIQLSGADRLDPGDAVTLSAKASFENGYTSAYSTFNKVAQWSSSAPAILESQGAGRFRAVRPGQATIKAQDGAVQGTLPVTVLGPDLVLVAADGMDPVAAGGGTTYQLTCTNRGPGLAHNVQITAQYDARTPFVSASPAADPGTSNRWSLGDLLPGESVEVTAFLTVSPGTAGSTLTLAANATADFAAASASQTTVVQGAADLRIEASLTPGEVRPGGSLSSTLTFRNAGSAVARDVVVEGAYPAGVSFEASSPAPGSGQGTWFVGDLAPGEERIISLQLRVASSAAGTLVLGAGIRGSDVDPMPADNQAAATADVVALADLGVSVSDTPDPALSGEPVTYRVTVLNSGPSEATAVALTGRLPDGMVLQEALPDEGSCEPGPLVACVLGSLPAGASAVVEISGLPGAAGSLPMTASVHAAEEDPDLGDNALTITTQVGCGYVLSAAQIAFGAEGGAGSVQISTAPGCAWTAVSGVPWVTITAGAAASGSGTVQLAVAPNPALARTGALTIAGRALAVAQSSQALDFHTIEPCRLLDTRSTSALASGVPVTIQVTGLCGVPATAKAVTLNVTAVSATANGNVTLWPANLASPSTSVVNFSAGATRANNAILALSTDGQGALAARASVAGSGSVHLLVDVTGYFE
ncbi:MAG: M12 family metallopeptidase [Acidobacteriota bacterium]